jgi:hypothetical protein
MKKPPQKDIFITIQMSFGKVDILEAKGIHYFRAMKGSDNDTSVVIKKLMLQIVIVNNNLITEIEIDEMLIKDVNHITELISIMMQDPFKEGIRN